MRKLPPEKRAQILHMLCEGNSIRAIERMAGCSKNTISKLLVDVGKACTAYHDEHVRNLESRHIQCDEIWSFTYSKQKNVATAKASPEGAGDTCYNFVREHKSLNGLTPAMAAGVSDRLWEMSDIVALVEAAEPKPGKRGPYKKRNSN